jgi:hypothetical protein
MRNPKLGFNDLQENEGGVITPSQVLRGNRSPAKVQKLDSSESFDDKKFYAKFKSSLNATNTLNAGKISF